MHLESFTVHNFRKFGSTDNTVYFVCSKAMAAQDDNSDALIAPSSTLIIGKNNAGKTTIAKALAFIREKKEPKSSDFNTHYIKRLLQSYQKSIDSGQNLDDLETPKLTFSFKIKVNIDSAEGDLVNNLHKFVSLSKTSSDIVEIHAKYTIAEEQLFKERVSEILSKSQPEGLEHSIFLRQQIQSILNLIDDEKTEFKISFITSDGKEVGDPGLKNILNIKEIKANRHLKDNVLSDIYKKVISAKYTNNITAKADLTSNIDQINQKITESVSSNSNAISSILQVIEQSNHVGVDLSGAVDENTILRDLIRYSFSDGEDYIPENQFGLGYINLLNIIGEIIHYIDNYENKSHRNQINLLFIEEPEAFMHPQMQEFFITRIDNAVRKALTLYRETTDNNDKVLHCQLIITTHSSHIVNSKIHSSNSFDNINYLHTANKNACSIKLDDKLVVGSDGQVDDKALSFIKKHIKYKVSELFFSDAVIFVEGITEETLLQYYIEKNEVLRNHYISVFNINGAHGNLYHPLAKAIKIPCLIITDLDIKRSKCEKNEKHKAEDPDCSHCGHRKGNKGSQSIMEFRQIGSLNGRITTNSTLIKFSKSDDDAEKKKLEAIDYFEDDNLYVICQKDAIRDQYATSFEEALILTNFENDILNNTLLQCKKDTYNGIVNSTGEKDSTNLINHSYQLQRKLSKSKSDFANTLLFECLTNDSLEEPNLPSYIIDGFTWLSTKLSNSAELNELDDTTTSEQLTELNAASSEVMEE